MVNEVETSRTLIRVVNALEGYRLGLHESRKLSNEERSCLERLMEATISTAVEYGYPIEQYDRWFRNYTLAKNYQDSRNSRQLRLAGI